MDENVAEVVIEEDEKLMRKALEALKAIDEALVPTVVGDHELSMIARRARDTITKLEQRLLNE